jgi:hypothetical protein
MQGDRLLFETVVDEDAVISWSSDRNLLSIPDADGAPATRAAPVAKRSAAPASKALRRRPRK